MRRINLPVLWLMGLLAASACTPKEEDPADDQNRAENPDAGDGDSTGDGDGSGDGDSTGDGDSSGDGDSTGDGDSSGDGDSAGDGDGVAMDAGVDGGGGTDTTDAGPGTCAELDCDADKVCDDSSGTPECVDRTCSDITCDTDQVCDDSSGTPTCVGKTCSDITCGTGKVCDDSSGTPTCVTGVKTCSDITCTANSTCDDSGSEPVCVCDSGYLDDGWTGVTCQAEPVVVWSQDFESGFGTWSSEGGVWAIGAPTDADGPAARGGTQVAGTVLNGPYPNNTTSRLVSPPFLVPSASDLPRLRFWFYTDLRAADVARTQIRQQNANGNWTNWQELNQHTDSTEDWRQLILQLSGYGDRTVQVAFQLAAANNATAGRPGFFIDDVSLETGPMIMREQEDFEAGPGDWSGWSVGEPTDAAGPAAHDGMQVIGTELGRSAINGLNYNAVTPVMLVPDAARLPRMRFWSWHDLRTGDVARLRIRVLNANGSWTNWQNWTTYTGKSDGWTQDIAQLSGYAGSRIQMGFQMAAANNATAGQPGFFVDGVSFETGPMDLAASEDFEHGFGDWASYGGIWSIGAPSLAAGPSPHSGASVAGTMLDATYPNNYTAWLFSPVFLVAPASDNPRFQFWSFHDLRTADVARIQIRQQSANGSWSNWAAFSNLTGQSNGWNQTVLQLSNYAGRTVQIGFQLAAANNADAGRPGFYIDDFAVLP